MKRILVFILMILILTTTLNARNIIRIKTDVNFSGSHKNQKEFINNYISSEKQSKKLTFLWSVGANFSSYLQNEGEWQPGYNLGLTFNIHVYRKLSITLPCSYTRINTSIKNIEGKFYSNDGYIYKMFVDRQISVGFLEFPMLFSYNFFSTKKHDLNFLLGAALAIAVKDFSKSIQPEDVTISDEIIGTHDGAPLASPEETFTISNSGFNINSGIRFHVSRFYIDLLYSLYPYKIKDINKLNTITLKLGIDVE